MNSSDTILKLASSYHDKCVYHLTKIAFIKKLPGGKYRVVSEKGKNLGTYTSKESAKKRLKQIEYFKYLDSLKDSSKADDNKKIDLTGLDEFSFSSLMRELRKKATKEQCRLFLKLHKSYFDKAIKDKIKNPEKIALTMAFTKFKKLNKIKFDVKIIKTAASADLGDPKSVGKYLADIVRFTLKRISPAKRQGSINRLKHKFYYLNENEIALKKMPASSAMGQSITFVKTVLFSQNPKYVREVLNHLVRFL
jgi:hypothetical protein